MHRPTGILTVLILGALGVGVVADDDDDDSGVTSALAAAFIRVKTREIERLLHTSWCVVSGPSCPDGDEGDARSKRSTSVSGSSDLGTSMQAAINSFSRCVCAASRLNHVCNLNISLYPDNVDHFAVHSSFSVVFHWLHVVKDFYCYINPSSTITCDYSQHIDVPLPSRVEIQNFAKQIQGGILQKSECGEFCGRFRCIYEAWSDDGRGTFDNIYEKCIQHLCSVTTTTAPPLTLGVNYDRTVHSRIPHSPDLSTTLPPYTNHTIFIANEPVKPAARDTVIPDAAPQDGADLEPRGSPSSLVGGLVGGLLAMALLAVIGLTVLMWRKKQSRKHDVPPVSCVFAGQTDTGQSNSRDYTNLDEHTNITATNPLACNGVTARNADIPDVIPGTAELKVATDDTYATLNECEMSGPHDNPAYDMKPTTNKGEELVLGEATPYGDSFYLEGIYAKPADNSEVPGCHGSASSSQYLEPVSEDDRYVRYPPHYLQPLPELPNSDQYIEPCSVRNGGHSDDSYIRMDNTTSVSSTDPPCHEVDQYVRIDESDPNYYNM
ncbi:uncharacterized protein LOC124287790 [Haliotis rubra]|uniref:uncharacterized protein LOC124287790 n=1 Tax=Haliotis rubra TaxID=36100 RepID=UPI001EE59C2F|nr:uncharacterized protein LOC124287790 [Haliotis rubra]XP_046580222.1 uncharacterized protein LOC124287790 [Haliotis rubra]